LAAVGDPKGYYRALGVDRTASADDLKAAFRQRAKLLHPDGNGAAGDKEAFRLLVAAYEALRDPQSRLRYDAEALDGERRRTADPPGGAADSAASSAPDLEWLESWLRWLGPQALPVALPILAVALLVAVGLLGVAWSRVDGRDRAIVELTHRLAEASRSAAAAEAAQEQDGFVMPPVYRGELGFPAGSAELDAPGRARLDAVFGGLRRAIGGLPARRRWLVSLETGLDRAGDRRGLLVADWELALRRLRVTAEHLADRGIPAERMTVRFQAGAAGPRAAPPGAPEVTLRLVCCLPATGR
jgi:hypothetical protein